MDRLISHSLKDQTKSLSLEGCSVLATAPQFKAGAGMRGQDLAYSSVLCPLHHTPVTITKGCPLNIPARHVVVRAMGTALSRDPGA